MLRVVALILVVLFTTPVVAESQLEEGISASWLGDCSTAVRLLKPLSDRGDAAAQGVVASWFMAGRCGFPKSPVEGERLYRAAAEQGDISSLLVISSMYEKGEGIQKDLGEALKWRRRLAEQDPSGLFSANLAAQLRDGHFGYVDLIEAIKWYEKSAGSGYDFSREMLALMYSEGEGVGRAEGLRRLRKLADANEPHAMRVLAGMYELGRNAPQDYMEALELYRRLAELGSSDDRHRLGEIYEIGKIVQRDYREAVKWYRLGATDSKYARHDLGRMYHNGWGVTRNYAEAVRWFRLAADSGFADSQEMLGILYAQGFGVPQDFVVAHMWFNLAASSYSPAFQELERKRAVERRNHLTKSMTLQQIAEAHRLAREWQPR